jgi:hypothetical protein
MAGGKVMWPEGLAGGPECLCKDEWIMNFASDIVVPKRLDFSLHSRPLVSTVITYH